jgi:hypothetical protein
LHNFVPPGSLFARGVFPGVGQALPMSFELGWVAIAGILIGGLATLRVPASPLRTLGVFAMAVVACGLFLATSISAPLYRALPLLRFVQFPWRLLGFVALGAALLTGVGLELFVPAGRVRVVAAAACSFVAIALAWPLLGPKPNFQIPAWATDRDEMHSRPWTTGSSDEYLPIEETRPQQPRHFEDGIRLEGSGRVSSLAHRTGRWHFVVDADDSLVVVLRDVYYPGWRASDDGAPVDVGYVHEAGNIRLALGPGRHELDVRFGVTRFRAGARVVSIGATLVALLTGIYGLLRRARK